MACEKVKAWLSQAGVPFTARNVDEDYTAYDALIATGFRTVPLTLVGDLPVAGFAPAALTEALSARGLWPGDPETP
jgi:glutaredoxin